MANENNDPAGTPLAISPHADPLYPSNCVRVVLNLISPVAGVGRWAVVPDGSCKEPVPDKTRSPLEVTVPLKVGEALVASPKLLASVRSPKVNQPLFELFLIYNKLFAVSAHIL